MTIVLQVKRKSKFWEKTSSKTSLGVRKIRYKEKTLLCNKEKAMLFLVYTNCEIKYTTYISYVCSPLAIK